MSQSAENDVPTSGTDGPCDAECAASCPNIALRGDCQYLYVIPPAKTEGGDR